MCNDTTYQIYRIRNSNLHNSILYQTREVRQLFLAVHLQIKDFLKNADSMYLIKQIIYQVCLK